jgi:hypothetical protein
MNPILKNVPIEIVKTRKERGLRPKTRANHACVEAVKELDGGSRARDPLDIVKLIQDRDGMTKSVDALIACLHAKRTYYDVYSKEMVVEEDYATIVTAAKALIANEIGDPIKRQQILIHNVDSMDDLEQKLAQSPALCETLTRMLEAAKQQKDLVTQTTPQ